MARSEPAGTRRRDAVKPCAGGTTARRIVTDAGIDVDFPEAQAVPAWRGRYLLQFETPFRHARHDLGSVNNLSERLARRRPAPVLPWQLDHTGRG